MTSKQSLSERVQAVLSKAKASLVRASQNIQQKLFNAQLWLISFKAKMLPPKSPAEEMNFLRSQRETIGDVLATKPEWRTSRFPPELYPKDAQTLDAMVDLKKAMNPQTLAKYTTEEMSSRLLVKPAPKQVEATTSHFESYYSNLGELRSNEIPTERLNGIWDQVSRLDLRNPGALPRQRNAATKELAELFRSTDSKELEAQYRVEIDHFLENALPRDRQVLREKLLTPDYLDKDPLRLESELDQFMRARAAQTSETKGEILDTLIPTPENTLARVRSGKPVKDQFVRFMIAKRFENVLNDAEKDVLSKLQVNFAEKITASKLDKPDVLASQLKLYFSSSHGDNVLWREKMFSQYYGLYDSPSQVYEKLTGSTAEAVSALRTAIDKNSEQLRQAISPADWEKIKASNQPDLIRTTLAQARLQAEQSKQTKNAAIISAFQAKVAPKFDGDLVEELYRKKAISEAFRNGLREADGKPDVVNPIGTKEQFTKDLMKNLQSNLLAKLGDNVDSDAARLRAARALSQPYVNRMDILARREFLSRRAFTEPNQFQFGKALDTFDQSNIDGLLAKPMDSDLLAKSALEARVLSDYASSSNQMSQLCTALKLKLDPKAEQLVNPYGVVSRMPNWDDRLMALRDNPLKLGKDDRLVGTAFEDLGNQERQQLNDLAKLVYENRQQLDSSFQRANELRPIVEKFEQDLSPLVSTYNNAMRPLVYELRPPRVAPNLDSQGGLRVTSAG